MKRLTKRLTLCADDYGMHPAVSSAIIDLIQSQRVHATSCLVTADSWKHDAKALRQVHGLSDIGLHLNFSEGKGLSQAFAAEFPSLEKLLLRSHFRRLTQTELEAEIRAQFDCFLTETGTLPDFLDGHQHVHHLPQVRDALFTVLSDYSLPDRFWIRSVYPMQVTTSGVKSHIIRFSGAKGLHQHLQVQGIRHNQSFAGVYSLDEKEPYRTHMQQWLERSEDNGLIMCHPSNAEASDPIDHLQARQQEFNYLSGADFEMDCQHYKVERVRLSDIAASDNRRDRE